MDLKELTAFRTIIQEGTFAKAAAKLNYAQSTITNQIQRLEKELGIQLFKRGWEAELTDAGRMFASEVDKLIQHWNYAAEQARALQRDEIGTITIGGLESWAGHVLPGVLHRFREQKPQISCHIVIGNTDSLSRAVLQKQLDFAICGEPAELSSFHFEPLYNEKIAFIVPANHPLDKIAGISLEDLLDYPMVAGGQTCLYYLRLTRQLSRFTKAPFLYTVSQISTIPGFVRELDFVGVVLDSTHLPEGVVKIGVDMYDSTIPVGLLQLRKDEYIPASRSLLMDYIRDGVRQ
ncbi:LysR family transcriptional regulator [Paenibacillus albidus]|uniref:LysR family transcriptional regulator n=1 Tax=Paenibacillus albidus TaxID=2041023 RepID=A0A917FKS6_9BACL|nr:LysR family transcriptional regulator [Paenibacillus albidus]GGF86410.1 LysR family transcriptional regulator [Paenibacillus albidus]